MTDSKTTNYNPYQVSSGNSPFIKNDLPGQLPNTPHDSQSASHQPIPTSSFDQPSHVPDPANGATSFGGLVSVDTPTAEPNPHSEVSAEPSIQMPQPSVPPQPSSFASPEFESTFHQAPVEVPSTQEMPPSDTSMPSASLPGIMPQPTGTNLHDTLSPVQMPVRKNKIALFVGMFIVITLVVTLVAYYFMSKDPEVNSDEVIEDTSMVTEVTSPTRKQITYPTTNAISLITTFISQDSFSLQGVNTITKETGCVYTEKLDFKSLGEDTYKNITISYPDTAAQEACEFEDSLIPYEELYIVADGAFIRTSIDSDLESAEPLEQGGRLTGSDHIRSIFPYPTLLTVTEAYETSETETEVHATYTAGDQSGIYTIIVIDNKITNIDYELENTGQTWAGTISVDYTAPLIVLPSATTSS